MTPGPDLGVRTDCQVHDQPAAVVRVAWPGGRTLLPAEGGLPGPRRRVAAVGEGTPVAQHPIGQQPLGRRHTEVGHGGWVEEERQLGAVAGVLVAEGQARPHTGVRGHVVKHIHPHATAGCRPGTRWPPGRTQEDVVCDDLEKKREERRTNMSLASDLVSLCNFLCDYTRTVKGFKDTGSWRFDLRKWPITWTFESGCVYFHIFAPTKPKDLHRNATVKVVSNLAIESPFTFSSSLSLTHMTHSTQPWVKIGCTSTFSLNFSSLPNVDLCVA